MNLSKKVAVITGAASGIGAACARAFSANAANVVRVLTSANAAASVHAPIRSPGPYFERLWQASNSARRLPLRTEPQSIKAPESL